MLTALKLIMAVESQLDAIGNQLAELSLSSAKVE